MVRLHNIDECLISGMKVAIRSADPGEDHCPRSRRLSSAEFSPFLAPPLGTVVNFGEIAGS